MIESKTMKKELTNIKAILFDMGNVLIFFDAKRSSKAFSEAVGVPEDKIWKTFFVSDLERAYTRGEISSEDFFRKVSGHFPQKIDFATFAKLWNDIFTENREMRDLLKKLKKHYPLYLISNTNDLHFEYVRAQYEILHHFTKCFPSHVVGHRKPDRAMFEHVLLEIKLKPDETIFIDDISEFVESAKNLGIHGIQFTSRQALENDLRRLGIQF
ncbi:MAG: hypothetical protein A3C35_05005 [Omnitrophica bacterium RIFCSPHIGHO2_02_FULL_46_11]|nr:MAG: hypothetical protein A3C35_05005 [Omnitrophica bacterium RIFCSPHIGHO2_02_FULL_46_11]OGW87793.1 MAG: hypothetical protein A3A81_01700 [Omnitrophica bacterium RIFCSPLOWO2_01_FULL_45_10b]